MYLIGDHLDVENLKDNLLFVFLISIFIADLPLELVLYSSSFRHHLGLFTNDGWYIALSICHHCQVLNINIVIITFH